jgi:plastocyanin
MSKIPMLLSVMALAFVAGCGDDDDGDSGAAATTSVPTESAPVTPAPPQDAGEPVVVAMKNIAFEPKTVEVKVGQTVSWPNEDSVDHNVVATDGEDFKSDNYGKGETYEYKFEQPGTVKYTCTLHPGMDGEVTVTE